MSSVSLPPRPLMAQETIGNEASCGAPPLMISSTWLLPGAVRRMTIVSSFSVASSRPFTAADRIAGTKKARFRWEAGLLVPACTLARHEAPVAG